MPKRGLTEQYYLVYSFDFYRKIKIENSMLKKVKNKIRHLFDKHPEYWLGLLKGNVLTAITNKTKPIIFSVKGRKMKMRFPTYKALYKSIFIDQEYAFYLKDSNPRILDLGANVGMSILYFKTLYPNSTVTAFEADPEIFEFLKENIELTQLTGIELYNQAAWISGGKLEFIQDGLGGSALRSDDLASSQNHIFVQTIDLKVFLEDKEFDIAKIDIEGAEIKLIPHIIDSLKAAKIVIFEYHSWKNSPQNLGTILNLFKARGYLYYLKTEDKLLKPLLNELEGNFDNRIVIYCSKNNV
jgi:FkbM family methyltransferase